MKKKQPIAKSPPKGLRTLIDDALHHYFTQLDGQIPQGLYGLYITQVEPPLIEAVLRYTCGNKSLAATLLDMSRTTLMRKMKKYEIIY